MNLDDMKEKAQLSLVAAFTGAVFGCSIGAATAGANGQSLAEAASTAATLGGAFGIGFGATATVLCVALPAIFNLIDKVEDMAYALSTRKNKNTTNLNI